MIRCAMFRTLRTMPEHPPLVVELDDRLGQIEVNRPACDALFVQQHRQLFHAPEIPDERCITPVHFLIAFENPVYVGIRHSLGRTNHARSEISAHRVSARVDFHDRAHHQPVDFWIQ